MDNGTYYSPPKEGQPQQQYQQYHQYQTPPVQSHFSPTPQPPQNQPFTPSVIVMETHATKGIATQPTIPGQVDHSIPPVNRSFTSITSLEQVWRMPFFNDGRPTWRFWFAVALFLYVLSMILFVYLYVRNASYYSHYYYDYDCEKPICP